MGRVGKTILVLTMMSICVGSFGAGSATSKPPAVIDTFSTATRTRLDRIASEARNRYHIPGLVVFVSVPGEGMWEGAYGHADLKTGQPLSLEAHLPIGSVTKTFTATVILQLVQQGLLALSAPISRWVPQVQDADQITVRMLLNMTSGIYDEYQSGSQLLNELTAHPHRTITPEEVVRMAVAHGPVDPPGTPGYSSTNYVILGIIAQDITQKTIGTLITSQVLLPLHLDQTSYSTSSELPSPSALDYIVSDGSAVAVPLYDLSNLGAAGGMVSTVSDMAVWAQALGNGRLLSPSLEAKRLQFGTELGSFYPLPTPKGSGPLLPVRYGLGLFRLGGLIGHNGEVKGYVVDVVYSPSHHATIVVFANGDNPTAIPHETAADAITVSIADVVLENR
jgi:D-alanyl-D-alanine carboxypeptidase